MDGLIKSLWLLYESRANLEEKKKELDKRLAPIKLQIQAKENELLVAMTSQGILAYEAPCGVFSVVQSKSSILDENKAIKMIEADGRLKHFVKITLAELKTAPFKHIFEECVTEDYSLRLSLRTKGK